MKYTSRCHFVLQFSERNHMLTRKYTISTFFIHIVLYIQPLYESHTHNNEKKTAFTDYSHYAFYIMGTHSMCIVQQSFASYSSVSSLGALYILFSFLLWASWLGGIHGFCVLVNYRSLLPICHFVEYFHMHIKCNVIFCLYYCWCSILILMMRCTYKL